MTRKKLALLTVSLLAVASITTVFVRRFSEPPRPGRANRLGGSIRPEADKSLQPNAILDGGSQNTDGEPTKAKVVSSGSLV